MQLTAVQRAGLAGALLAGLALITARLSESWAGLVPCALCLVERWPYRLAILLCVLALAWRRAARSLIALAALTMLASAAVAAVHVGVEQGYWPSPLPECQAPNLGQGSIADRLARMPARPSKPCDDPTYLVPALPISMAGMNLGLSLLLAIALAATAAKRIQP